jgi:hypothetical protein
MIRMIKKPFILVVLFTIISCNQQSYKNPVQGEWIKGTEEEKIKIIEKQFRGFDNTMVETGYRFQELYWAGHDENWEYANYQLEKIKAAIEIGLVRRPKRAKSAEYFLTYTLPEMKKELEKKDPESFNKNFNNLTISCNNCHAMEKVSFFTVKAPTNRKSPIIK